MRIQPVQDMVLVQLDEETEETAGGVLIPEDNRIRPKWGTIIGHGPGRWGTGKKGRFIPIGVELGQRAAVNWEGGQDFTIDGHELKLISERQILAVR